MASVSQSGPVKSIEGTYDQLLNEDSLADTGTTEETNLTTTGVRGEKVDDLDTSDENLGRGGLVDELGGFGVNRGELGGLDGTTLVNGVTSDVHDTTETAGADGDLDGGTGVGSLAATDETLGTVHGNAADDVLTQMLLELVRGLYAAGARDVKLTATSRMSFWPPFSVVRALRMAGSCSPSNLTVIVHQHGCYGGDSDSATLARRQWRLCLGRASWGKGFLIPSTTAPMTWWILPSREASVLAKRWLKAGANEGLMGWKARCRVAGRRAEALNDLAMPLWERMRVSRAAVAKVGGDELERTC